MKKPVKIILLIIAGFIIIALMVTLVWGKTIRMATANKLFSAKDLTNQTKAAKIYEDMAVDEPNSPYVLHNLGLGQYVQGKFDQAASSLQKALKAMEGIKLSPQLVKTLLHRFQYHSGNATFKLAAKSQTNPSNQSGQPVPTGQPAPPGQAGQNQQQQTLSLYQAALENYRQAIESNPDDLDAKYNYELTKLRIKSQQNQNQQSQDQQGQNGQQNQNQNNQQQSGNQKNQQNQPNQSQQQQSQSKPGQMSKEEADALLKMAEKGDQYQGQLIFGAESPTTKDW